MARIVQKFGGTSVADIDRIRNVARRVKRETDAGNEVAVVVSAMAGVTNQLVAWTRQTCKPARCPRIRRGRGLGRAGDGGSHRAGLAGARRQRTLLARLADPDRAPTACTARRASSISRPPSSSAAWARGRSRWWRASRASARTTASPRWAAAARTPRRWRWRRRSRADRCDIFTDVDGVYTTDPRIVAKARKLDKITYEEMLELASQGAKVLQTRSVEMAMNHRVRVQVLSSFTDAPGYAGRGRGRDRGKASGERHRL